MLYAVLVAAVLFLMYPSQVEERAYAAIRADRTVVVDRHDDWVSLAPADRPPVRGLVFYPGAHTDPRAYLPTWAPIVKATGTAVFVPRMPLHFAPLDAAAAARVLVAHPEITRWWVGGHSFGGFAAARFLERPEAVGVEGAVLWASYPPRDARLSAGLRVLAVTGGRDGVVPTADARDNASGRAGVQLREIVGMEHSQFGAYRSIFGEGNPTISDATAHAELAAITSAFLGRG